MSVYVLVMVLQICACLTVIGWLLYVSSRKGGPGFSAKSLLQHSLKKKKKHNLLGFCCTTKGLWVIYPLFPSAICKCHIGGMQMAESSVVSSPCSCTSKVFFFRKEIFIGNKKMSINTLGSLFACLTLDYFVNSNLFLQSADDYEVNNLVPHSTAPGNVVPFKMTKPINCLKPLGKVVFRSSFLCPACLL